MPRHPPRTLRAGFLVADTGARYKNASANMTLASDRITVNALHVDDSNGHSLEVRGSLGTHELRVGDITQTQLRPKFGLARRAGDRPAELPAERARAAR